MKTRLCDALGIRYPLVQAPMAGGPSTPELAAAVSNAGGLGSIATGYQTPDQIRAAIRRVRALTDRPFAVNLFAMAPSVVDEGAIARSRAWLQPYRAELGLGEWPAVASYDEPYAAQVAVLLEERVPVLSFTFGIPPELAAFKQQGTYLMGTATTVAEARELAARGVDAVVAQGAEAGGHRGTFLGSFESSLVGTMALVPQVVDAVDLPVIAAGGLMDGRGIVAALALGAVGVQMGTAFLRTPEAGTHPRHREVLGESADTSTTVTRAFSGKPVRALENRLIRDLRPHEHDLPAYPIQNALTRELRRRASDQGRDDLMGMWSGQAGALARPIPAGELVTGWMAEVEAVLGRLR